jgi:hypothetical protein
MATPPMAEPTMTPMEGEEDFDDAAAAVGELVEVLDWDWDCEELDVESVVGVGVLLCALLDGDALVWDVGLADGVGMGRRMLGMAVGMAMSVWLDRKDATTPPTLWSRLFSWRSSLWCFCWTRAAPASPAARQLSCIARIVWTWSGWIERVEAWLS